jgi:hypothetical protein
MSGGRHQYRKYAICIAAVAAAVALSQPLRHGSPGRGMLYWYFDQAELDSADCTHGYPCTDYHGAQVDISANFLGQNMEIRATDQDGSLVGSNTASTGENTTYSATSLPTANNTLWDATKNFVYGAAGYFTSAGVTAVADKVEQWGTSALQEANMLLPQSNYTKAITEAAGWVQTTAGQSVLAGLSGV